MWLFTEREIIDATGGIRIGSVPRDDDDMRAAYSVSTDTRTLEPGALFVALVGEHFDGHAFCQTAFDKDASLMLISDEHMLPHEAAGILVPDTLLALHALARAYRKKLGCKVIAVTGSVGKTSTREMLFAALSHSYRTHATRHNLNNEIGLPLTILTAPPDTELLIVEMGMRLRGEIQTLTLIAEPDMAVITNVGVSHIERLGSQEEILLAKMEICEGLSRDKVLLINGDDLFLTEYIQRIVGKGIDGKGIDGKGIDGKSIYGNSSEDKNWRELAATTLEVPSDSLGFADQTAGAYNLHTTESGTAFSVMYRDSASAKEYDLGEFLLSCVGVHHVRNALFAVAIAMRLGVAPETLRKGLLSYKPAGSRGKMIQTAKYLLYDDAYNASPESMAAAFESIRLIAAGRRKIAAIGGILELGSFAAGLHYKVGESAAKSGIDILLVCGDEREDVKAGALAVQPDMPVYLFETRDELAVMLMNLIRRDDVILIKGSHAFEMEKITKAIIESENECSVTPEERGADT